jgi:hypothetical protein
MKLERQTADKLRTLTMEFILDARAIYLREYARTVAKKHWDHLATAIRIATRTAGGPEEWATIVTRQLRLPSLTSSGSQGLLELTEYVHEHGLCEAWFDMLSRESGHVMALARATSDARKATTKEEEIDHVEATAG